MASGQRAEGGRGPAPIAVQIVLAAGRSERMGRPKPLLEFDGRTALDLVLEAGSRGGAAWSVTVLGGDDDSIIRPRILESPGRRVVVNPDPRSEQLRSIQIALEALREDSFDAFFLHPADCPLVGAVDYALLLDAFRRDEGKGRVYVPSHSNRRGHPLLLSRGLEEEILSVAAPRTMRDVVSREKITYVLTSNPGVLEDMDTPSDYARLLEMHRTVLRGRADPGVR